MSIYETFATLQAQKVSMNDVQSYVILHWLLELFCMDAVVL